MILRLLAAFALLIYLGFSLAWLSQPGPYYDEWIFVPVSLRTLGACDIEAAVTHHLGCLPLTQAPPYVGAIKAWLMAPVFALFGVDAWTVRLPPILLGVLVLVLLHRLLRESLGGKAAALTLLVLAVDPAFIWHTRLDWGPFAIANLCKVAGFIALLRWIERGRIGDLAVLLVALCIGLYDKLSFLWVTAAFGFAALVVEPRALMLRLRTLPGSQWALLGAAAALHVFGLVTLALPAMSMPLTGVPEDFPLAARLQWLWNLYNVTFAGTSVFDWMFDATLPARSWPAWLQAALFAATIPALWHLRGDRGTAARLLRWSTAVLAALILCLLATRQVGGSHHVIVAWPFPMLQVASLLVALSRRHASRGIAVAAVLLVAVVTGLHLQTDVAYARQLARHGPYRPLFDPALAKVAQSLREESPGAVVSAQWGLHQALLSHANPGEGHRFRDWWAIFLDPPESDPPRTEWLRREFLVNRPLALVEWSGERTPHIDAYLRAWQACPRGVREFASSSGAPLVRVREFFVPADGRCEPAAP